MPLKGLLPRVALATALIGAASMGGAAPASAAACSSGSGVTVVIDNGSSISTRCAGGDPSSAIDALKAVAAVVSPQRFPGSVVCRIDGFPSKTSDPCMVMPPETAYWAFFHAPAGGTWIYSSSGVASYNPAPGSVIGFRFGSGQAPRVAPPAAPAPKPSPTPRPSTATPKPTVAPTSTPTAARPRTSTTSTPATPTPSATLVAPSGSASTATKSPNAAAGQSGSPSGSTGPAAGPAASPAAAPATTSADEADAGGSPWGVALAALAVLGLGAVALRTARQRHTQVG